MVPHGNLTGGALSHDEARLLCKFGAATLDGGVVVRGILAHGNTHHARRDQMDRATIHPPSHICQGID